MAVVQNIEELISKGEQNLIVLLIVKGTIGLTALVAAWLWYDWPAAVIVFLVLLHENLNRRERDLRNQVTRWRLFR